MENEVTNSITENKINLEPNNEIAENVTEELAVDSLAVTLDYYDRYYQDVLDNTNTIIVQQQSILDNQDNMIEQNDTLITLGYCTIFIISIVLIYNVLRNMIITK